MLPQLHDPRVIAALCGTVATLAESEFTDTPVTSVALAAWAVRGIAEGDEIPQAITLLAAANLSALQTAHVLHGAICRLAGNGAEPADDVDQAADLIIGSWAEVAARDIWPADRN